MKTKRCSALRLAEKGTALATFSPEVGAFDHALTERTCHLVTVLGEAGEAINITSSSRGFWDDFIRSRRGWTGRHGASGRQPQPL